MHADELREVLKLVDGLDPREKTVLRLRFGLDGDEPKTLKEIGEHLDLTRERVRADRAECVKQAPRDAPGRVNPEPVAAFRPSGCTPAVVEERRAHRARRSPLHIADGTRPEARSRLRGVMERNSP